MGNCSHHGVATELHEVDGDTTVSKDAIFADTPSTSVADSLSEAQSQCDSPTSCPSPFANEDNPIAAFTKETVTEQVSAEQRSAFRERRRRKDAASGRRAHEQIKRVQKEGLTPRPFGQWALHALFLGRKLPGVQSKIADTEIFYTFCTFLSKHCDDLDPRVLNVAQDFCAMHMVPDGAAIEGILKPSCSTLWSSLQRLQIGGFWSTWIHAQNAVVFIERTSESFARISMWPVQPPANKALGAVPGFIRIPEESFEVAWTTLATKAFASRIAEMSAGMAMAETDLDVANPTFVKDYFLPALGGDAVDLTPPGHCIAKKVRDESRLREGVRPWRRPCAWLALKSLLHYACLCADRDNGQSAYKCLVIRFLAEALSHVERNLLDDSAVVEAARKIARRLYKLQLAGVATSGAPSAAAQAVQLVMQPVTLRWRALCEEAEDVAIFPENLDFEQDIVHRLNRSKPVLEALIRQKVTAKQGAQKSPKCAPRSEKMSKLFSSGRKYLISVGNNHDDITTSLFDAEYNVMSLWERWESSGKAPVEGAEIQEALPFLKAYLSVAQEAYKNDVEGRSRMVLATFTVAMLVDRYACKEHPELSNHSVGLEHVELSCLVLACAQTKKVLHSLEKYMASRRTKQADGYTSILHPDVHERAFGVNFARNNQDMQRALRSIADEFERGKRDKAFAVQDQLRKYNDIRETMKNMKCICKEWIVEAKGGDTNNVLKCNWHAANARSMFLDMDFLVSFLPQDESARLAVVFELQIPSILACLRDVLYIVTQTFSTNEQDRPKVLGSWVSDTNLSQRCRHRLASNVQLAYTKGSDEYKSTNITAHPTFVIEDVGRDTKLADMSDGRVLVSCPRWSLQEMLRIETTDPKYQALQFAVESWNHSENMAIACKGTAPKDLCLREFETFACLRAGIHLQLPRLLRALAQQALSFDRRGVLDVLSAILMQVGPASHDGSWRRQAHKALESQDFCDDLCSHATILLEQQATNWSRHQLLLAVISIGSCVLQHAPKGQVASKLLLACRDVACRWIDDIRVAMGRSSDADAVQKMRLKLVDIAASATLTYDIVYSGLLQTRQHAETFLWLRASVADNIILGSIKLKKVNSFRFNLLRKSLLVALRIEDALHKLLARTDALTAFVKQYWVGQGDGTLGKWRQNSDRAKHWYETTYIGISGASTLQMDVLRGTFLVNGEPVGRLPTSISAHDDYIRLFGDAVFEVQPISGGGWQTACDPGGAKFSFFNPLKADDSPIIMEERFVNGSLARAQLVSHRHFKEDVPDEMVDQYSHWLVRDGQTTRVFFRPRRYNDKAFQSGCSIDGAAYVLDVDKCVIADTAVNRQLVDVRSRTFAELYDNAFCRVAPRSRVHIFHAEEGNIVILPDLQRLQFHVIGVQLRSHEFGSYVAADQRLGTLVGLQHGLVLEEPSTCHRTLLMPHAATHREVGWHRVHIKIDELRQPPVFVYNVRDDLRELHGQKDRLAWLYLAKLHALTASPLPDPFLGRTGTSQALRLLSSGHCRGNLDGSGGWASPLADATLVEIAQCSVARSMMKKNKLNFAEKDNLCDHPLPALCAHDGFAWIVKAMRAEAKQAAELAGAALDSSQVNDLNSEHVVGQLSRRAYLRSRDLCAADARLSSYDETEIMGPQGSLSSMQPWPVTFVQVLSNRESLRAVAVSFQKSAVKSKCDLDALLLAKIPVLRGCTGIAWPEKRIDHWHQLLEPPSPFDEGAWLAHSWLDLYKAARGCVGADRDERLCQLSLCCSFLAERSPSMVDNLLLLSLVALHADHFATIEPPKHARYTSPHEVGYASVIIKQEVAKKAVKYDSSVERATGMDESPNAQQKSNKSEDPRSKEKKDLDDALSWIDEAASAAHVSGKMIRIEECRYPCIADPSGLCDAINSILTRWKAALELHYFVAKVVKQIQSTQRGLEKHSSAGMSLRAKFPLEHELRPAAYELRFQKANQVNLMPEDIRAWTHGEYVHGQGLGAALSETSSMVGTTSPPDAPIKLPMKNIVAATNMYGILLRPMQEAWELASAVEESFEMDKLRHGDLCARLQLYARRACNDKERVFSEIQRALEPVDDVGRALEASGLWPAAVPIVLLRRLLSDTEDSENWRTAIGAFAVYLRHHQRAQRCLHLLHRKDFRALQLELRNPGCEGWVPSDRPEWLLLELDNNMCIRSQQAAVAHEIMSDDNGNRLLQLIMGAGKTAVIVPMVIASLANGERCVRVTVLEALHATNAADWQFRLGGLLAKRVYSLSCKRDIKTERHCPQILDMLRNAHRNGHVLVTIPQHRMSLENKALELANAGHVQESLALQNVVHYFDSHGRDILDESDEILHPKFQLIYTLGHQLELDGCSMRWIVGSAVLHSVTRHVEALRSEFGDSTVEIKDQGQHGGNHYFPSVRLLDQAKNGGYAKLCELIADDFLSGVHPRVPVFLKPGEILVWKRLVLDKTAPESDLQSLSGELHKLTLLLRGLLAHGVLFSALQKRWRVEYGAHPLDLRLMAVPFRAKDVASEKTEFGHPETALLLTTLHYYHGGLSSDQLRKAFQYLGSKGESEAQAMYASWVQGAPALTVRTWMGINLDDSEQFVNLILPALRRHMKVIDFWLDQVVFPREAKQYPQKLVSTAWDLCRADTSCVTTGFSGTDDAHLLLPLTISQNNMQGLKATNGVLLHNVLRKENDRYFALSAGASGRDLLNHVSQNSDVDVLLDPGALVVEMSNRAVAELWLKTRKDRQAAVYFEGSQIHVVDRLGYAMPLAVSRFESSLEDCLLYLDDEHTRGADFQLPIGRRAVVTLGKGMQKDKLLQAVMRMRRLGQGHAVSFVASFEANLQISAVETEHIISLGEQYAESDLEHLPAILSWCLSNTVTWTCEKLLHLARQGTSHLRKRHACLCFVGEPAMVAAACAETEQVTLEDLYGYASHTDSLPKAVKKIVSATLSNCGYGSIADTAAMIEKHVNHVASDVYRAVGFIDEEQERELEEEIEEEREVEVARPRAATPCEPKMSTGVLEFARSGRAKHQFLSVAKAFEKTFYVGLVSDFGNLPLQVTHDFINTVLQKGDNFLRPVTWTLVSKDGFTVLVSNFEAEELAANYFDRSGNTVLHLVVPGVRHNQAVALTSLPKHIAPSIAIEIFAGSVHGDANFANEVRRFLGICERQPSSFAWRLLFEERSAIGLDGFVLPEFREEVAATLGVELGSTFTTSPIPLIRRLYHARHLDELLLTSPMGQVLL